MLKSIFVKKEWVTLLISLIAAITPLTAVAGIKTTPTGNNAMPFTVVLDAGHGGIDGGVTGKTTGVKESDLNLAVASLLKKDFLSSGFDVVMTRTTAAGLYGRASLSLKKTDMQNRKKIIEKASPDLVISIHMNEYPLKSRRGAQVFFKETDKESEEFANSIQKQLNGLEESTRDYSALSGNYYVLNVSPCPAVIVECGFLSNAKDEALLTTEEYRARIAYAVYKGAVQYLTTRSTPTRTDE